MEIIKHTGNLIHILVITDITLVFVVCDILWELLLRRV